ncbi:MAG: hypothetical protein ACTSO9_02500 [Candidatus Helarchaeota archaeon]
MSKKRYDREKEEIHPLIDGYLKKGDYLTFQEWGITLYSKDLKADVIGLKWENDMEIQTVAVECKQGSGWFIVSEGINQAISYQFCFHKVYIATETPESELYFMEEILKELNIGYLQITEHEVKEVFPPGDNPRFDKNKYFHNVYLAACMFLVLHNTFNVKKMDFHTKNVKFAATNEVKQVQIMCTGVENGIIVLGLCIMKRDNLYKILNELDPKIILNELKGLENVFKITFLRKGLGGGAQLLDDPISDNISTAGIEKIFKEIRKHLKKPKVQANLRFDKKINWDSIKNSPRTELPKIYKDTIEKAYPLYKRICEFSKQDPMALKDLIK